MARKVGKPAKRPPHRARRSPASRARRTRPASRAEGSPQLLGRGLAARLGLGLAPSGVSARGGVLLAGGRGLRGRQHAVLAQPLLERAVVGEAEARALAALGGAE